MDPMPAAYNGYDLVYNLGLSLRNNYDGMEKLMQHSFDRNDAYNFSDSNTGVIENKSISVLQITEYKLERLNK